jgi:limonene-1,2-epoxide hydrolase
MERRHFVFTAISGLGGGLVLTSCTDSQEWSDTEKANVKVVDDFCATVATRDFARVRSFLSTDLVYRMSETAPPLTGMDALAESFKKYVESASSVEFTVLKTFALGPIVINHRIDRFLLSQPITAEVVGVFFLKDGRIKEWSDYTIRTDSQG